MKSDSGRFIRNGCSDSRLQCLYMNARSIVNKKKELELTVRDEKLDIIAITESWLNVNITDEEMGIKGYTLFRKDRNDSVKRRGGRVAIYVKNELNPLHKPEINAEVFAESLWCSISCGNESTLLGVCYRAPDSSDVNDANMYNLLNGVGNDRVIVMGDFNFAELD